jgi:hypothetical protein
VRALDEPWIRDYFSARAPQAQETI